MLDKLGSVVNWSAKFSRGYDSQIVSPLNVDDLEVTVAGLLGDVKLPVDFWRLKETHPRLWREIYDKGEELLKAKGR